MVIRRVSVPMGVVAIIYESRPNVTSDAAALALKSGNVCVLRGGKEAFRSANAIVEALREGLPQQRQKLLHDVPVYQTDLLRIAHAGPAGLGVLDDIQRHLQIRVLVHINLDYVLAVGVVDSPEAAAEHIAGHSTGHSDCIVTGCREKTTVVGAIGYNYAHKEAGTSVFDPVFALAAILEWAGIASNERGELVLTTNYQEKLRAATEGR